MDRSVSLHLGTALFKAEYRQHANVLTMAMQDADIWQVCLPCWISYFSVLA